MHAELHPRDEALEVFFALKHLLKLSVASIWLKDLERAHSHSKASGWKKYHHLAQLNYSEPGMKESH